MILLDVRLEDILTCVEADFFCNVKLADMREKWRETERERELQPGAAPEDKENEEEPKKGIPLGFLLTVL